MALLLGLAACGRDSTGPADDGLAADAELGALGDPAALAGVFADVTGPGAPARGGCAYSEESGRVSCPPVTRGGLTITRSFAFYDAGGASQPRYDALTTAAINVRHAAAGTISRDRGTLAVDRWSDVTVSGLAGEETARTWDGTEGGTTVHEVTGDAGARRAETTVADTIAGVVLPVPRRPDAWPLAGARIHTARTTVARPDGGSRTFSVREVVTFNGTRYVPVEITTERGTRSCTRDLATGRTRC